MKINNARVDCEINKKYIKANDSKPSILFLNIDIIPAKSPQVNQEQKIIPNTILCIDCSGSMADDIDIAKEGAKKLISDMDDISYVSVIAFSDTAELVVDGGSGISKSEILSSIDEISIDSYTNLSDALELAYNKINSAPLDPSIRADRVILLSDGIPTVGETDLHYFEDIGKKFGSANISIVAGGFGEEYDEEILMALANGSRGGKWRHIEAPEEILGFIGNEGERLTTTLITKPEIRIKPISGAEIGEFYQRAPEVREIGVRKENKEYIIPVGDIVWGEIQSFVAKLRVPPKPEGVFRIAQVKIPNEATHDLVVEFTSDMNLYNYETSTDPRNWFITTVARLDAKTAIEKGDETIAINAIQKAETVINSSGATQIIKKEAEKIKNALENKDIENLSKAETKVIKQDLTTVISKNSNKIGER